MTEEFKDFSTKPSLCLDPFNSEKKEAKGEEGTAPLDDSMLSDEEKKMVDDFAEKIDLRDSSMILKYGAGTQKKLSDFSGAALENVRTKDLGEIGTLLSGVVKELKGFGQEEEKGFLSIFRKPADKVSALKVRFAKAQDNVSAICDALEKRQVLLMKDIAMLDKMYEVNLAYFKELTMYILAGKKRLKQARDKELKDLQEKAKRSGLPEDAQAARDLASLCERFEKKLGDLQLTRAIAMQTAPQIRLVQGNDAQMAEKIQSTIVNTIPLWKSQMVLALGVEHSALAAKAQREVSEMTNEFLIKNAEKLKTATITTAKETNRGIVDMETLKQTNEALIATFDEVIKIQDEGKKKRAEAEKQMAALEDDLRQKLLQIRN